MKERELQDAMVSERDMSDRFESGSEDDGESKRDNALNVGTDPPPVGPQGISIPLVPILQFGSISSVVTPVVDRFNEVITPGNSGASPLDKSIFAGNDENGGGGDGVGDDQHLIFDESVVMVEGEVENEIGYWQNAIVCKVLGRNPPLNVFEGFIRRTWDFAVIENVSIFRDGIFAVRFFEVEALKAVLDAGMIFLDKKPVLVREWAIDLDLTIFYCESIPVWVKNLKLDLKYWGERSLSRLASILGKLVQIDKNTTNRRDLRAGRVLVDVPFRDVLPTHVGCRDEKGGILQVQLKWEWAPVKCSKCLMLGHMASHCVARVPDDQGFVPVLRRPRLQRFVTRQWGSRPPGQAAHIPKKTGHWRRKINLPDPPVPTQTVIPPGMGQADNVTLDKGKGPCVVEVPEVVLSSGNCFSPLIDQVASVCMVEGEPSFINE